MDGLSDSASEHELYLLNSPVLATNETGAYRSEDDQQFEEDNDVKLESDGGDEVQIVSETPSVLGQTTGLLSLANDTILAIGAILAQDNWEQYQETAFMESTNLYSKSGLWRKGSADLSWPVLAPLAQQNRRIRQVLQRLMWQAVTVRDEAMLPTLAQVGQHVRFLRLLNRSQSIPQVLQMCPNVQDVALAWGTKEDELGSMKTIRMRTSRGLLQLLEHKPAAILSFTVFGRAQAHPRAYQNASPLAMTTLGAFKSLTTLCLRGVFGTPNVGSPLAPSKIKELEYTHLSHQLVLINLCPALKTLDMTVGDHPWPTLRQWKYLPPPPPLTRLVLEWHGLAAAPPPEVFYFLDRVSRVEKLELRNFGGRPVLKPQDVAAVLPRLGSLRMSGTSWTAANAFVANHAFPVLTELVVHDDHFLFDLRNSHPARVLSVLEAARQCQALLRSSLLHRLELHAHRNHLARQISLDTHAADMRECEEFLPFLVGPVARERAASFRLILHV